MWYNGGMAGGRDVNKPGGNNPRGNPNWVKGKSAHPFGRPRRYSISAALVELVDGVPDKVMATWGKELTGAQELARELFEKSRKGNMMALIQLMERVEGKVPTEVTGNEGQPLIPQPIIIGVELGNSGTGKPFKEQAE